MTRRILGHSGTQIWPSKWTQRAWTVLLSRRKVSFYLITVLTDTIVLKTWMRFVISKICLTMCLHSLTTELTSTRRKNGQPPEESAPPAMPVARSFHPHRGQRRAAMLLNRTAEPLADKAVQWPPPTPTLTSSISCSTRRGRQVRLWTMAMQGQLDQLTKWTGQQQTIWKREGLASKNKTIQRSIETSFMIIQEIEMCVLC